MKKKLPLRKCVVSQERCIKNELFRVVKTPDGNVCIDDTGKMNGRGAYVKKTVAIIEKAQKTKQLDKALGVQIDSSIYEQLLGKLSETTN